MDTQKIHKKVFFEIHTKDDFMGKWIYSQWHMRFSDADIPSLFGKRPYKEKEEFPPDYLYRIDGDGIHIALFYDGLPVKKTDR
jgi:hypothetical protein